MAADGFELQLDEMVHGGNALGRSGRRVISCRTSSPARIRAQMVDERKGFAFARAVEVLAPAPERVTPRCPHFGPGPCGGCHLQHIDYAAQLRFKRDVVIDQLTRIGGFRQPPVQPTLASLTRGRTAARDLPPRR